MTYPYTKTGFPYSKVGLARDGSYGWGPQIVGFRPPTQEQLDRVGHGPQMGGAPPWLTAPFAQAQPRMRPFVLTCPNCVAPLDANEAASTDGFPAKCRYCQVPLRWEPAVPLTRDDQMYRYDPTPLPPRASTPQGVSDVVRGIGPVMISGGTLHVVEICPQTVFRPRAFWVEPAIANNFMISNVRVGENSVHIGSGAIPCSACTDGEGLDIFSGYGPVTMSVGVMLQIHVENRSGANWNFSGVLRGTALDAEAFHRQAR